jgi:hypothetical protein
LRWAHRSGRDIVVGDGILSNGLSVYALRVLA